MYDKAIEGIEDMDVAGLQELHSQMLAQASDLGFDPPDDTLVEFEDTETGRSIVKELHEALSAFRAGIDTEDEIEEKDKKVLADDNEPVVKDTSRKKTSAKKAVKTRKKPASEEATEKETTVAKEPKTEKSTAKKTAKKAAKAPTKKAASKKAAKAPAKKAAPKKEPAAPRSKFDDAAKITWIYKGEGNGVREGSGRWERREAIRKHNGKTVATFLKNGGNGASLARAVQEGAAKVG